MKTLKTDRLILRLWKMSDLDDMFEYASVPGVGEMAGWPHHTDKDVSKTILQSFIDNGDVYAIVLRENKKVIGSLGVHNKSADPVFKAREQRTIGFVFYGKGSYEAVQLGKSFSEKKYIMTKNDYRVLNS